MGYKSPTQDKNIAWYLPRPKPDHYKGGMPLHCERWLLELGLELCKSNGDKILNVFCGMNKMGVRADIKKEVKPDILCDIHKISDYYHSYNYDIILADPPYSNEENTKLYNIKTKLNYKKWSSECDNLLKPGGILIIYHKYVMPNPNPEKYEIAKRVFIGNRIYHTPRIAIYFQKKGGSRILGEQPEK